MKRTVVNHLHVVSSTILANPITAGLAVSLGGGLLKDFFDCWPGSGGATGHERRAIASTLFTTGDTRTDK